MADASGKVAEAVAKMLGIDTSKARSASFSRPANARRAAC